MSAAEKIVSVTMIRANLDKIPEFALPDGFSFRWYQPGDEAHWLRIHLAADKFNEITPGLFRKQFAVREARGLQSASACESGSEVVSALRELSSRQLYLLDPRGEVIGTGTAWFDDHFAGARWGRVHWVAVLPEFQGRGLAKPLMSAVCRCLRELRHERAYLRTSTARLAAINLYRRFGFEPLIHNAGDEAIWREVAGRIGSEQ